MKKTLILTAIIIISIFLISCGGEKMEGSTVTLQTNKGEIRLELFTETMPITTGNFIKLAKDGFYDGTKFHRVIDNFMIQGGDPLTKDSSKKSMWGTGDPGYKIKDEFTDNNKNDRGTISMANAGPNTGGSQFFINLVNNNFLDSKHPAFGKVVTGMDVVDTIAKVQKEAQDRPVEDVVIEKVVVE
tara:strand:+ start:12 stop:569 length:558 start_codon:yes stop_codon:yes gene_type:complete